MSREHKSRQEVLGAIKSVPSMCDLLSTHEGHFDHELDLEVIVYGRNYAGKRVGPYLRLLTYDAGETIIREGDWGGNTYYVVVEGAADVYVGDPQGKAIRVSEIPQGMQFGEMALLAGAPRSATIKAPVDRSIRVLEIQRPALRLLRKLPKVGEILDRTYRTHGKKATLEELRKIAGWSPESTRQLEKIGRFRVFGKNHILVQAGSPIEYLYFIREGWVRRSQESAEKVSSGRCKKCGVPRQKGRIFCLECGEKLVVEDFWGRGRCFGLEGLDKKGSWPYGLTLVSRAELLQFPITKLQQDPQLEALLKNWDRFAAPASTGPSGDGKHQKILSAQERLILTGVVDGTNLLVMDMDLCVRCGNCSLACHKVHGQSRLLREGIFIARSKRPRGSAIQSVLVPAVCMHCKDPECLTGCPTGAIGRMPEGYIDIQPKTCIGCGDCAAQCPYNAISMVPRKPASPAPKSHLKEKIADLLRIKFDPLPAPVDQSDDLVAVKCNLCAGTPLNPAGSKTPAYSCELNCPTGALARIVPRNYFSEIGKIEGLTYIDRTHAVGRNIHQSDPPKRLLHFLGIFLTLLFTAATVAGIAKYGMGGKIMGFLNMRWLTGILGLVVIVIAMMYPFRRQIYRTRSRPLRYWMLAHAYAGVLASTLIVLHGGSNSGGMLTALLMWSFDLVILTGLFGIGAYVLVPRLLTKIEEQPLLIDSLTARRKELQEEIAEICDSSKDLQRIVRERVIPRFISVSYLFRQYFKRLKLEYMLQLAKDEFNKLSGHLSLVDREQLDRAVEAAATMRRVDALIYLHRLLKIWLPPHVIFTSLMLALMFVHIFQVIFFAWR